MCLAWNPPKSIQKRPTKTEYKKEASERGVGECVTGRDRVGGGKPLNNQWDQMERELEKVAYSKPDTHKGHAV